MSDKSTLAELNVQEVLELVENGEYTPEEAIEIEQSGKRRRTIIETLEKLIDEQNESQDEIEVDPQAKQKEKVVLLKNIKYNTDRFKIGEEIEVDLEDMASFIKAGIIAGD